MARRTNIRQRGTSWVVHYRNNGKQHWRSFKTREEAEQHLGIVMQKRARGESIAPPTRITFAELAADWLRVHAKTEVRASTFAGYESVLRVHLLPEFGQQLLGQISQRQIDAFRADWLTGGERFQERVRLYREQEQARARAQGGKPRPIRFGTSPKTVRNAIVLMKEILAKAVEWGYCSTNPAANVKRPKLERREMQILDARQVQRFLAAAEPEWYAFFLTAVTTGARLGELLGLKWKDLDAEKRRLGIERASDRQGRLGPPKTDKSIRKVAITPSLLSALRRHRIASRFKDEDDLIFANRHGAPLDGVNLSRRQFKDTLRRAGLPEIRFHDLRHTYASLLLTAGVHVKLVSEQLGHSSIAITADRYSHVIDQSYDDATDSLEAVLTTPRPASDVQASDPETVARPSASVADGPLRLA
jgi:integrase